MASESRFTEPSQAHQFRRRLSTYARQTRAACRLFFRSLHLSLLARFPSRREFLVVPSAGYAPGLFSAFATVLGLLEHYDKWRGRYAGIRVDFGKEGLYYDPSFGSNWWEYFFDPIGGTPARNTPVTAISADEHFYFAHRVEKTMPRKIGFALIDRYVRLKPSLRQTVDAYVRANFEDAFVVGVHYRGTDKFKDAPRVPYKRVHEALLDAAKTAGNAQYRFFVATDEQAFLDYMLDQFPGKLHYLEMYRSIDGTPIDVAQGNNRKKGENAVMDCLLLSRCHFLVRTASNLGLCSTLFNPDMPVMLLNCEQ